MEVPSIFDGRDTRHRVKYRLPVLLPKIIRRAVTLVSSRVWALRVPRVNVSEFIGDGVTRCRSNARTHKHSRMIKRILLSSRVLLLPPADFRPSTFPK